MTTLTLLGDKNAAIPSDYAPEILEAFPNKHPGNDYLVTLHCPEFTSLCPITGQPGTRYAEHAAARLLNRPLTA